MGQSSVPTKKSEYTTSIMAKDALALLDHIGWEKAHISGQSMGSMIACKLAAMAPHRLSSLVLFNVTGGGYECFPKVDRQMISLALRFLRAKTPEERAMVDLETHYTKEYLDEDLGSSTRRQLLYQQYVRSLSSNGVQTGCGFEGQANACWKHNMTPKELDVIRSAGFPIFVIHGRYDIVAQVCHARKLANDLKPMARMIELHGAHLVTHERPDEVCRKQPSAKGLYSFLLAERSTGNFGAKSNITGHSVYQTKDRNYDSPLHSLELSIMAPFAKPVDTYHPIGSEPATIIHNLYFSNNWNFVNFSIKEERKII